MYVGLDIHKKYCYGAVMDEVRRIRHTQEVLLRSGDG
jgi:hypothetical protein